MNYKTNNNLTLSLGFALLSAFAITGCGGGQSVTDAVTSGAGTFDPYANMVDGSKLPKALPVAYKGNPSRLTAAWANDGANKITREGTPATNNPAAATNSVWKDSRIQIFGAKNEVVSFNLILEAARQGATDVKVTFDHLDGPGGAKISGTPATGNGVFDYTKRDIELFFIRYLKIEGISRLGYERYDERHIPERLQRPNTNGVASGGWTDRPDHDKHYPDIAVPLESVNSFNINQGENQSVWSDIYIPKDVPSGLYQGAVTVTEGNNVSYQVPVELNVRNFALPEVPSSKTMLYLGTSDISRRYIGMNYPENEKDETRLQTIRDRHFQMAHRHKIALIDNNHGRADGPDQPTREWIPRLNGQLFSSAKGYRGPGQNVGNGIFSVGTFGSAEWQNDGEAAMHTHSNAWANWFAQNSNETEFFLYLIDESSDFPRIQNWAGQMARNSGSGRKLSSMATLNLPHALDNAPDLRTIVSTMDVGDTATWDRAQAQARAEGKNFYMYNGKRPSSGTFMVDDDGVALRELPWGQYKKGIARWFYWESTYYKDFQAGRGDIDVMNQAQTFGGNATVDNVHGRTAGNYANGDGLLFYPGTDTVFRGSSYGLDGPIASLRIKHWRRGIQDVDYLTLAARKNPAKVQQIVNSVVGKVLWENGVDDINDPTWKKCPIGWSNNPDSWEAARKQLMDIIEGK